MAAEPTKAALNLSQTGAGKTLVTVELAKSLNTETLFIVAPLSALNKVWKATLERQGWPYPIRLLNTKDSPEEQQAFYDDLKKREPGAYLVGREYYYLSATPSKAKKDPDTGKPLPPTRRAKWLWSKLPPVDLMVVDECFKAGTKISTPLGNRNIEDLRVGDLVYGYNHVTNRVVVSQVNSSMARESDRLIGNVTPNHPYWVVGSGYLPFGDVIDTDRGLFLDKNLRVLQKHFRGSGEESETEVLQSFVFESFTTPESNCVSEIGRVGTVGGKSSTTCRAREEELREPRVSRSGSTSNDNSKPRSGPRNNGTFNCYSQGKGSHLRIPKWWEWARTFRIRIQDAFRSWGWLGFQRHSADQNASRFRIPDMLQDRRSEPCLETGGGMRWTYASGREGPSARRKENAVSRIPGVDHLAILEPRNPERYRRVFEASKRSNPTTVYNLETSAGNYFANGFLVHNCHSTTNRWGLMFSTLKTHKATYRLALSATPQGSKFDGFWSVCRWLWPNVARLWPQREDGEISQSKQLWETVWCTTEQKFTGRDGDGKPTYRAQITGEKEPGTWVASLPCVIDVKSAAFVKRPYHEVEVRVSLTPEQRKMYSDMEKVAIAWLQDNPTVAKLPVEQRLRLRQITLAEPSIIPVESSTTVDSEGSGKTELSFHVDAPSPKIDAALHLQKLHPGESILFVTDSAKFAKIAATRLGAGLLAGTMKNADRDALVEKFGTGELQYLVCTYQKAGESTDGLQHRCSIEVLFNPADSAVLNEQYSGRLNRMGQTADVITRYRIVARDTVDQEHYQRSVFNVQARRNELTL